MRRTIALLLLLSFLGTLPLSQALAQPKPGETSGETLIRNATVLTITRGTLQNADVLIRKGKIAAIGKGLKASPEAHVIPAFFSTARTSMRLDAVSLSCSA